MRQIKGAVSLLASIVRQGLVMAIPFLMLGSFALVLQSLPLPSYQSWLEGFAGGGLHQMLDTLYQVSLNSLALVLCITIAIAYSGVHASGERAFYALTCVGAYLAFTGYPLSAAQNVFGPEWAFTAMCVTTLACAAYRTAMRAQQRLARLHTIGVEYLFNQAISAIFPSIATVLLFALAGIALHMATGENNILNFGSYFFLRLFESMGNNLVSALLYVLFSHVLWFFGIHGTNTLEAVSTRLFEQGIEINAALVAQGLPPTEIFTKTFLDVFVFLGGCGSALCFILAVLLVARRRHNRRLAMMSALPVFFNISETAIFGFPILLNPAMLIPFILTPIALLFLSGAAMALGLVPPAIHSVGWTVPVFFSGYQATGSLGGCLLQVAGIIVGVAIYIPFVRLNERRQAEDIGAHIRRMEQDMSQGEQTGRIPEFLHEGYERNMTAKTLTMDLRCTMEAGKLELYYQPQVRGDGSVYGVEALLRWKHPVGGMVFPPLVIALARQGGFLDEMGLALIECACRDMQRVAPLPRAPQYAAVNISPYQLESPQFVEQVQEILSRYDLGEMRLALEFTERVALSSTPVIEQRIAQLRAMGVRLSMDDFGMGHSSMMYLTNSVFDEVKLDGALVREMLQNERSRDIIRSITSLSDSLHFHVVAEYVETLEQIEMLERLGCHIFQGYYFSKALPLPELMEYLATPSVEKRRV